jgi:hypothetical protein
MKRIKIKNESPSNFIRILIGLSEVLSKGLIM